MDTKTNIIDRELSWLDFNARVLDEAYEKENPLMERMRFLAITASNLDEFIMVRVAGVMDVAESGRNKVYPTGLTAQETLPILDRKIRDFVDRQYSCLSRSILPQLEKAGIRFVRVGDLTPQQLGHIDAYFEKVLFPVLTPMAVDRSRPFPRRPSRRRGAPPHRPPARPPPNAGRRCSAAGRRAPGSWRSPGPSA